MFGDYAKDPRVDTDAEVKVAEMAGHSDTVFWESVIAASRFEQNQLAELRLYPIELGHSKRFAQSWRPTARKSGASEDHSGASTETLEAIWDRDRHRERHRCDQIAAQLAAVTTMTL